MITARSSALAGIFACDRRSRAHAVVSSKDVHINPITDDSELRETLSQIKDDLVRFVPSATPINCSNLIDYVEDMPFGHDSSFGAICKIKSQGAIKQVTLCDDRMVGKFFQSEEVMETAERVGVFIQTHCPPGG
jgi:hypothetical protein